MISGIGFLGSLELVRGFVFCVVLVLAWRCRWEISTRRQVVFFGACVIVVASLEFWVLGPYSFLDFPISIASAIPFYQYTSQISSDVLFTHALAGGNDLDAMVVINGQFLSLERFLISHFPVWMATGLHKAILFTAAYIGTYRLARAFGADRMVGATLAGSYIFAHEFIIRSTWSFGLGYAGLPLLGYLMVARQGCRYYWPGAVLMSALYTASNLPTHSGLAAFPFLVVLAVWSKGWGRAHTVIPGVFLLLLFQIANWSESIWSKVLVAPYTLRGEGYAWATGDWKGVLTALIGGDNTSIVLMPLLLFALGIIALRRQPRIWGALAMMVFSLTIGAVLVEVPWKQVPGLGMLAGLNLNNIQFMAIPLVFVLMAGASAGLEGSQRGRWVSILLLAFMFGNFAYHKAAHAMVWLSSGGQVAMESVNRLDRRAIDAEAPVRTVVVPYRLSPNMLWPKGIETFDGYYNLVLSSVAVYWRDGVLPKDSPKDVSSGFVTIGQEDWDLKCCESYQLRTRADLDLLRIANVGFVVSPLPLDDVAQVGGPAEPRAPTRRGQPVGERLVGYINELFNPAPLYVYALGGQLPRVFAATGVEVVADDKDLLAAVKRHALTRKVVTTQKQMFRAAASEMRLQGFQLVENGIDAKVDAPAGGILVVNVPFTPFWRAQVDGKDVEIIAANMIHMAVVVPPGGHKVSLHYHRRKIAFP